MNPLIYPNASRFVRRAKALFRPARLLRRNLLLALGSASSIALLGCGRGHASVNATAPHVVRVVEIGATDIETREADHYTGVVRARYESNLGFRVAGKIAERLVSAGDAVRKGQPLLKLDPADYQLALQAARAAVDAARAVHTQASLEQARVRLLVDKRAESRDVLDKVAAAAESSAAQLRSAEAQAELITDQANYTTLYADSDGVVMTTLAEPGQVVAAGQPVVLLAKDGAREAAVDIPESSLEEVRHGAATARLYLDAKITVPATLREIAGVADPVSRTYQARYVLQGDPAQFPLGATVTVHLSFDGNPAQSMVAVPLASLIDRGDGAAVWVVDPRTSALRRRAVSIAKLGAETALISRGLAPGDLVVALGAQLLNAGEVVRMVEAPAKEIQ